MPEDNRGLGDGRLEQLAEAAAEKAVIKTLRKLRIRADDDDDVDGFIDTIKFAGELRVKRDEIVAALAFVADVKAGRAKLGAEVRSTAVSLFRQTLAWGLAAALGALGFAFSGFSHKIGPLP